MAGAELRRAGVCLPAAMLLHALLLAAPLRAPDLTRGPPAGTSVSPRAAAVEVRTLPAPAARAAATAPAPPTHDTPAPAVDPVPAPPPAPRADAMPATTEPPGDDLYLDPGLLDQRARATGPIALIYPDLAPPGAFRAELTLFIDEDGWVRRVRIEPDRAGSSALPAVLEDSARQSFLGSRFTPGEIAGRAVRSRLRVEVEFRDD
ncbi:MAG: hypothetical protein RLZZ592_1027 [Pseudomonadota bacterium]